MKKLSTILLITCTLGAYAQKLPPAKSADSLSKISMDNLFKLKAGFDWNSLKPTQDLSQLLSALNKQPVIFMTACLWRY